MLACGICRGVDREARGSWLWGLRLPVPTPADAPGPAWPLTVLFSGSFLFSSVTDTCTLRHYAYHFSIWGVAYGGLNPGCSTTELYP